MTTLPDWAADDMETVLHDGRIEWDLGETDDAARLNSFEFD